MPDTQIHPLGDVPVPAAYTLAPASEVLLKGAFAKFDGSAAAGSFKPLVRIVSDAGSVALESPADVTVAAGASADASWFPFVAAASTAGGGIQYDTDNEGDWLYVGTSSSGGPASSSIVFNEHGFGDIIIQAGIAGNPLAPDAWVLVSESGISLRTFAPNNDAMELQFGPNGINWVGTSNSVWNFENDGTGGMSLSTGGELSLQAASLISIDPVAGTGGKLSFFNAVGATQAATPVTLADVIALLRAYGLAA